MMRNKVTCNIDVIVRYGDLTAFISRRYRQRKFVTIILRSRTTRAYRAVSRQSSSNRARSWYGVGDFYLAAVQIQIACA